MNKEKFEPYSSGKIVIVDGKKAKIIDTLGEAMTIVFQQNGKYRGEEHIDVIEKNLAESLHLRKIFESKNK